MKGRYDTRWFVFVGSPKQILMTQKVENAKNQTGTSLNLKAQTGSSVLDSGVHASELPPWTRLSHQQQEGTPCILSSNIHPAALRWSSSRQRFTANGAKVEDRPGGRHGLLTCDRKKSPNPKRHGCSFLLPPRPGRFLQLLPCCRRPEIR